MPRRTSKPTDPWAVLDALNENSIEPEGPEWFYAKDFRKRYKLSVTGAGKRLNKLVEDGFLEVWRGHVKACGKIAKKYRVKQA